MSSSCSQFSRAGRSPPGPAALELVARRFAVLALPLRLKLIQALLDGEHSVTELVARTGASQTNVSRQLQTLTQAQILKRRRSGLEVHYAIADRTVLHLCTLACGSLEKQLLAQADTFG